MRSVTVAFSLAALVACGQRETLGPSDGGPPPAGPSTTGTPEPTPTPAATATPTPTPTPAGDGRSTLQVDFQRSGGRAGVTAVDLQVLGVAVWLDARPAGPVHGAACDASGAEAFDRDDEVRLDARGSGATRVARVETARQGEVAEVRLFLRGEVVRLGRAHNLDGAETCVWRDGWDVAVLRIHPAAPVAAGGADWRLVVPFDPSDEVQEEHVRCDAAGGAALRAGGGIASPASHTGPPDECRQPEDAADDGDPRTRLRYVLVPEVRCDVEPLGS